MKHHLSIYLVNLLLTQMLKYQSYLPMSIVKPNFIKWFDQSISISQWMVEMAP